MITRRQLMQGLSATTAAGLLPGVGFASADTDSRFVLLLLRGALDGLALAAPWGDRDYRDLRGELALPSPGETDGLLPLDDLFGLHPAMPETHRAYTDGDALIVHAIASPYRERSHFDGQDLLEQGGASVGRLRDGWLNRALGPLTTGNAAQAIALAQSAPLVLRGDSPVTSWAPSRLPDTDEATLDRLADLYAGDPFFATRLAQALRSKELAGDAADEGRRRNNYRVYLESTLAAAARFLLAEDGPRIAVIESSGWDTHANQGAAHGQLARRLAALDAGIAALRSGLGPVWRRTVVAVVTEFGRTVRVNGTRGSDHGTAGAALLVGGAVNGGRVIADWPGLGRGDLYQGRDLQPTADLRGLFKGVLADHLGLPAGYIEREVFPSSGAAKRMQGLVRDG